MEKIKKYWREITLFIVLFHSIASTSNFKNRLQEMEDEISWAYNTQEIEALEARLERIERRIRID